MFPFSLSFLRPLFSPLFPVQNRVVNRNPTRSGVRFSNRPMKNENQVALGGLKWLLVPCAAWLGFPKASRRSSFCPHHFASLSTVSFSPKLSALRNTHFCAFHSAFTSSTLRKLRAKILKNISPLTLTFLKAILHSALCTVQLEWLPLFDILTHRPESPLQPFRRARLGRGGVSLVAFTPLAERRRTPTSVTSR